MHEPGEGGHVYTVVLLTSTDGQGGTADVKLDMRVEVGPGRREEKFDR